MIAGLLLNVTVNDSLINASVGSLRSTKGVAQAELLLTKREMVQSRLQIKAQAIGVDAKRAHILLLLLTHIGALLTEVFLLLFT